MKGISPTGVWGYPSRASAEKGAKWFDEAVDHCVERIRTLKGAFSKLTPI
jgi:creatinine amidohydrolase/Fe(II)-dependent formamide hydrolase-like protein